MDKVTAVRLTEMWNNFPQDKARDVKLLLSSYNRQLGEDGISDRAAQEACTNFMSGSVEAQSFTFAPSMPEFMREARRIQDVLPLRDVKRIAAPIRVEQPYVPDSPEARVRMGFKMSVLSASFGVKEGADRVAEANRKGLEYLIALGQEWGVPVPEALWTDPQNQRT